MNAERTPLVSADNEPDRKMFACHLHQLELVWVQTAIPAQSGAQREKIIVSQLFRFVPTEKFTDTL